MPSDKLFTGITDDFDVLISSFISLPSDENILMV